MASTSHDLFRAIEAGDVERVRTVLAGDPSLASSRDDEGVSALMRARYRFDGALIEAVQRHVAELDVFEAASADDLDQLTELIERDDGLVHAVSGDGFTALHFAAFFGRSEAVRLLLARGADPNARGTGWMTGTPLHAGASRRHVDVVQLLLEAGADPDARQLGGWTPLHSAAHNGDARLVELLLAAGADAAATSDDGTSVRDLAVESGDAATIAAIAAR